MAHTTSAKKRILTSAKKQLRNKSIKSRVKTIVKTFENAVTAETLSVAFKEIDKAVSKGIIHKNAAARKKAKL